VDVHTSKDRFLGNREVCEEFDEDDHYVGLANIHSPPSSHIAVDSQEGYMFILHFGDDTYAKLVLVVRVLSQPDFVTSNPYFL
jgi:hypothetical protein